MPIAEQTCLTPPVQRFAFLVMEQRHDALLVVHISLFADKWTLHLVDGLLEKLLVLPDQQFPDALQTALALRD